MRRALLRKNTTDDTEADLRLNYVSKLSLLRLATNFDIWLRVRLPSSMAASSADLRDILALPGPSASPAVHSVPKKAPRAQKPEGISRELYSLIGNHAPSLAAVQQAKAKLKQKPKFGRGKTYWYVLPRSVFLSFFAAPPFPSPPQMPSLAADMLGFLFREWRTFTNQAREDSLQLGHWEKVTEARPSGEYSYISIPNFDVDYIIQFTRLRSTTLRLMFTLIRMTNMPCY